ncbi:MAG: hypothetical protein AB7I18_14080 [Candidatus Berkiella sp.]
MLDAISVSEESWAALIENVVLKNYQYYRYTIFPALECIMSNIQTIFEIYHQYPETCIALLEQAVMPFSPKEYEDRVIAPIMALVDEDPAHGLIVDSLRNLRRFLGDNPEFLNRTFQHQIQSLSSEDKLREFCTLCQKLCTEAVSETVNHINTIRAGTSHRSRVLSS